MAKRILSADSALMANTQVSLAHSVRTEPEGQLMKTAQKQWNHNLALAGEDLLFDWDNQQQLMAEIDFVNTLQQALDEATVRAAPSVLRIVLTIKAHLPDAKDQRKFLADNLNLDFRRISELCIVADSYGLLDTRERVHGEREIARYGWSKALKLAHVPDSRERKDLWERACNGENSASYRDVLEEIRRFRERKSVSHLSPVEELTSQLGSARELFATFQDQANQLQSKEDYREALARLEQVRRELNGLKRTLTSRMKMKQLAASA